MQVALEGTIPSRTSRRKHRWLKLRRRVMRSHFVTVLHARPITFAAVTSLLIAGFVLQCIKGWGAS